MSFKEHFLNAIGLRPVTNRDVLMDDLAELDDATFEYMVLTRQSDLSKRIDAYVCADCRKEHDGDCIAPEDEATCPSTVVSWLSLPCTREHLIPEVSA